MPCSTLDCVTISHLSTKVATAAEFPSCLQQRTQHGNTLRVWSFQRVLRKPFVHSAGKFRQTAKNVILQICAYTSCIDVATLQYLLPLFHKPEFRCATNVSYSVQHVEYVHIYAIVCCYICIYKHLTDLCLMLNTCLAEHDKQLGGFDGDPCCQ